jgi:hypothetical protein
VEELQLGPHAGLSDNDADTPSKQHDRPYPTPGDVLAEIARVIAVCLGLALLAQLVIPPPPGL